MFDNGYEIDLSKSRMITDAKPIVNRKGFNNEALQNILIESENINKAYKKNSFISIRENELVEGGRFSILSRRKEVDKN